MDLFVFSSKNLTNIWAGIGAETWAVSKTTPQNKKGRITKSKKMKIGSIGILYCVPKHSFTTPFIVYSEPDPEKEISDIWSETWILPFKIKPLGNPERMIHIDEAIKILPICQKTTETNISHIFRIQGNLAFNPTIIGQEDWAIFIKKLANIKGLEK